MNAKRAALVAVVTAVITGGSAGMANAVTTHGSGDFCALVTTTGDLWCASSAASIDATVGSLLSTDAIEAVRQVRFFEDANKSGAFLDVLGEACDTNPDADDEGGLPTAWNDRISSFEGYNSCEVKLYEDGNLTGATYGPVASTNYVGDTLNDEASSYRLY